MMIEDNRKKESVELAQKIINILCEENKLPKIPVIFTETFYNKFGGAFFDSDKYRIEITYETPYDAIIHEFIHYEIQLLSEMNILEENLVKRAVDGYISEGFNEEKLSKQKAKLMELLEKFAKLEVKKEEIS